MKRNKLITKLLHILFSICLVGSIVLFLFQLSIDFFSDKGKFYNDSGYTTMTSNHYSGYSIPVSIYLNFTKKKTYNHNITNESGDSIGSISFVRFEDHNPKIEEKSEKPLLEYTNLTKQELDSIFINSDKIKESGGKIEFYTNDKSLNLKSNTSSFIGDTMLDLKSDDSFFNLILLLRTYLAYIFLIIIFFNLTKLFKKLSKNFEFDFTVPKQIKNIGIYLIIWQITKLIISIICFKYFEGAMLKIIDFENNPFLHISPRPEFNFSIFIFGICLIILSEIFLKGALLKQENDLTI